MGLIDNLRNRINRNNERNKEKAEQTNNIRLTHITTREDGINIFFYNPEVKFNITYENGETTKLVVGKIVNHKSGGIMIPEDGKPVCFEIPLEMELEQVVKSGLLQEFQNRGYFNNLTNNKYNALAKISNEQNQWKIKPFSATGTIDMLNEELDKNINEKKQIRDESIKQLETHTEDNIRVQREKETKYRNQEKEQAMQNPKFTEYSKENISDKSEAYQTVNINTGDTIVLSNVQKLGKDENNMYLYMGYLSTNPVIFATAKKLDEIAKIQDSQIMRQIAELLSVNELQSEERTYLGQLDLQGKITRDLKDTSQVIQYNVQKQQSIYKQNRDTER